MKASKFNSRKSNARMLMDPKPPELPASDLEMPPSLLGQWLTYGRYQTDTYTTRLAYEASVSSDASGVWHAELGNSPTGFSNWASYAATFDEYRILGAELQFHPVEYNGQLVNQAPIVAVVDLDDATALTSYLLGARYPSSIEANGGRPFKLRYHMSGAENAQFVSTNAPVTTQWFKTYSTGNSASTQLGRVFIKFIVQFRAAGI
jgi:hypothetical protein